MEQKYDFRDVFRAAGLSQQKSYSQWQVLKLCRAAKAIEESQMEQMIVDASKAAGVAAQQQIDQYKQQLAGLEQREPYAFSAACSKTRIKDWSSGEMKQLYAVYQRMVATLQRQQTSLREAFARIESLEPQKETYKLWEKQLGGQLATRSKVKHLAAKVIELMEDPSQQAKLLQPHVWGDAQVQAAPYSGISLPGAGFYQNMSELNGALQAAATRAEAIQEKMTDEVLRLKEVWAQQQLMRADSFALLAEHAQNQFRFLQICEKLHPDPEQQGFLTSQSQEVDQLGVFLGER